ncbi:MAG TPA: hypothetical protein PKN04_04905 [bacterium]|nr:hypothetical protein [bacterium]
MRKSSILFLSWVRIGAFHLGGGSHQDPEQWTREKSMLHVAVTRARKAVWISGTGELSEFLHQG